jgi:hypothetical protein
MPSSAWVLPSLVLMSQRRSLARIAARVAQDQLVELAGFKLELLRREFMFAGRAEIARHLDRRLPRQVARCQRRARSHSQHNSSTQCEAE